jgi:hypothetical protein
MLFLQTVLNSFRFYLPIAGQLILLILHHRARKDSTYRLHVLSERFRAPQD